MPVSKTLEWGIGEPARSSPMSDWRRAMSDLSLARLPRGEATSVIGHWAWGISYFFPTPPAQNRF
ncbi:hypothetical protein [Nostoc sp. NOS(2021)]|uniref:hypothetical protein n=1 Tax=Nostoc sp. NOS(2021) TaxID=2815407 RepID=UPI0025D5CC8B|nr:hypothetical protein [Nostoc sp. NOS(2021)]